MIKKLSLLTSCLLISYFSISQNILFNDAYLKQAIIQSGKDLNHDGEISGTEAEAVSDLHLTGRNISRISDLSNFTNLQTLDISFTSISNLSNNSLPASLRNLRISGNKIKTADLGNLMQLNSLNLSGNELQSLFLPATYSLNVLEVHNNPDLQFLNIKANKYLQVLDVSNCPLLTKICVWQLPFPFSGVSLNRQNSPQIKFANDCCINLNYDVTRTTCSQGTDGSIFVDFRSWPVPVSFSLNNGPEQETREFSNLSPGKHKITSKSSDACSISDTITVGYKLLANPDLGNDTLICLNKPLTLVAKGKYDYIKWSNTDVVNTTVTVTQPGKYWAEIHERNGCVGRDTINIEIRNCVDLTDEDKTCFNLEVIKQKGLEYSHFEKDKEGNVYILGKFYNYDKILGDTTNKEPLLTKKGVAKFNSSGEMVWYYAPEILGEIDYLPIGMGLQLDSQGNIYYAFLGKEVQYGSEIHGFKDYFVPHIIKLNPEGKLAWIKTEDQPTGNSFERFIRDLKYSPEGYLYASGYFYGENFSYDEKTIQLQDPHGGFLIKINPDNGAAVWIKGFSGEAIEESSGIGFDSNNNIYQGGYFTSSVVKFTDGGSLNRIGSEANYIINKYAPSGQRLITKNSSQMTNYRVSTTSPVFIAVSENDEIFATSSFSGRSIELPPLKAENLHSSTDPIYGLEGFLVKYNTNLEAQKVVSFGSNSYELINGLATDISGNVYLAGHFYGNELKLSNNSFTAPAKTSFIMKFGNDLQLIYAESFSDTNYTSISDLSADSNAYFNIEYGSGNFSGNTSGKLLPFYAGYSLILKATDKTFNIRSEETYNICPPNSLELNAGPDFFKYSWTGGAAKDVFYVNKPGKYSVDLIAKNGCKARSEFSVGVSPEIELGENFKLLSGESRLLQPGNGYASYTWQNSATTEDLLIDASILKQGINLITVKVQDLNGCTVSDSVIVSLDKITSVTDKSESIIVSPNPANDRIHFSTEITEATIYDISGKVIKPLKIQNGEADVSDLKTGIYVLRLNNQQSVKLYIK